MQEQDGSISKGMTEVMFAELIATMLCVIEVENTKEAVQDYLNELVPTIVDEMNAPYR